jgi:hypothetical protein
MKQLSNRVNFPVASSIALLALLATGYITISCSGKASSGLRSSIDPSVRYFFFIHNYYVEKNGPERDCRYNDILKAFADRGFVVISEVRTGKIVPCTYAQKVVKQVRNLLDSGVPPRNITVGGHSKGGVITLCVASQLENPEVNFVVMAGCEIASVEKSNMYPDFKKLKGRILSLYASSDSIAGSCEKAFSMVSGGFSGSEIKLKSDAGHRLFFAPEEIWIEPVINWINNSQ